MIRNIVISCLALSVSACATTKVQKIDVLDNVEIRKTNTVVSETIDANETFQKAREDYAAGKFVQALAGYENTLTVADDSFNHRIETVLGYADSALALSSVSKSYQEKARIAYTNILGTPHLSEDDKNRVLAGQVLLEIASGTSEDAEVRLNEALEKNLMDPRLWNTLGRVHDQQGEWVLATETYVKAMEAAGESGYPLAPIINNMGMSYLMRDQAKDALKKFKQAHALNRENKIYDNNRRLALVLTGRLDKAVEDLSDKRAAQVYNDAGYISAGRGEYGTARYYYKKAIELSPVYFKKAELNLEALSKAEAGQHELTADRAP